MHNNILLYRYSLLKILFWGLLSSLPFLVFSQGISEKAQVLSSYLDTHEYLEARKTIDEDALEDRAASQADLPYLLYVGITLYHTGEYEAAQSILSDLSQKLTQEESEKIDIKWECSYYLAKAYIGQKKLSEAAAYVDTLQNLGNPAFSSLGIKLQLLEGELLLRQGAYQDASDHFQARIADSTKLDDPSLGMAYKFLGQSKIYLRLNSEAYSHLLRAEELIRQSLGEEHPELIFVNYLLTYAAKETYLLVQSKEYVERAIHLGKKYWSLDHPEWAKIYYYAGDVYTKLQEYTRSASYFREAIRLNRLHEPQPNLSLANFYMLLGGSYRDLKDTARALDALRESRKIIETDYPDYAYKDYLYLHFALTYFKGGDFKKSIASLDIAFDISSQKFAHDHPGLLSLYKLYGESYEGLENHKKALYYFSKARDIELVYNNGASDKIATYHWRVGKILRKLDRPEESLDSYKKALDIFHLSHLVDDPSGPYDFQRVEHASLLASIFLGLAHVFEDLPGNQEEIRINKQKAFQVLVGGEVLADSIRHQHIEQQSKLVFIENNRYYYSEMIRIAFDLYELTQDPSYLEQAFHFGEKSKALLLLLNLQDVAALNSSGISARTLEKEREVEIKIKKLTEKLAKVTGKDRPQLEKELFVLTTFRDSLIGAIEQEYPAYYQAKYKVEIPKLAEMQALLRDSSSASISFFWGEKSLYSFYFSKDTFLVKKKEIRQELGERIGAYRNLIYSPFNANTPLEKQEAHQRFVLESQYLFKELLSDVYEGEPARIKRWKIIPDGVLGQLNFELLIPPKEDPNHSYKDLAYLIHEKEISYSYSAALWKYLKEIQLPKVQSEKLLALRPEYPEGPLLASAETQRRSGFGPLFYSKEEVDGIGRSFSTKVLEGMEASEENFSRMAGKYKFIHISSHAQVSEDADSDVAFIAFTNTGNGNYDDSLRLAELSLHRLNAEMVVLSACETGTGRLYNGEGVMSLGRGFTAANARSLVMSLWEVNDASTADIITRFYTYLAEGESKDAALRRAKLDFLEESDALSSHPYYWAAFVASGDMRPVSQDINHITYLWIVGLIALVSLLAWLYLYRKNRSKGHI